MIMAEEKTEQKALVQTLELYMALDLIPVGTVIICTADGWTVCNGFQALVGTNLKDVLQKYLTNEKERIKKARKESRG